MEKVKLAAVGLGNMGSEHAYNARYNIRGAELTAICARTREKVLKKQEELDVENIYTDYDEMISRPELDGVIIVSPSAYHCEHIVKALDKGLHIFVEKPIALTLEEIDQIEQAWERQGHKSIIQLGFMRRFDPSYLDAKKKIEEGLIGEPYMVKSHSCDPIEMGEFMLRYSKNSGGLFFDMTQHCFDLTRWVLGCEAKRAFGLGGAFAIKGLGELGDYDNGAALVEYEGGKIGMYHSGRAAIGGYRVETEIQGTEGMIRVGMVAEKNLVTIHDKYGCRRECIDWYQERFKTGNLNELKAFVDCVRENRPASVSVNDGRKAIETSIAVTQSIRTGQIVEL